MPPPAGPLMRPKPVTSTPTYKPEQTEVKPQPTEPAGGSTNEAGQIYIPGFGYVDYEGNNVGIKDDSMYENGNKIGIMGG